MTLELPEPPSANRYWRVFRGRAVKSSEARAYGVKVKAEALRQRVKPITGDVCVSITWHRAKRMGDLDNRLKVVLDALQGVAFVDDKQVKALTALRLDSPKNGKLIVTVEKAA